MSGTTLDPSEYDDDHYPARGGDWVGSGDPLFQVAKIKRVWRDSQTGEFLADLILYAFHGERIGRRSPNQPFKIGDVLYRGPRSYEPSCPLRDWYRIEPPEFPIEITWKWSEDGTTRRSGRHAIPRPWGKYGKRKRAVAVVAHTATPNYDRELERRARKLAIEILRDTARETNTPVLKERADALEREMEDL